jgi:hypothetical protein
MRNFHGNIPFATTNLWFGKRKTKVTEEEPGLDGWMDVCIYLLIFSFLV